MAENAKKLEEQAKILNMKAKKIESPKKDNVTSVELPEKKEDTPPEKSVNDLLSEGKSLGEIQT